MPGWRRCCSKWHFNQPRGEQITEPRIQPGRSSSPRGQRYSLGRRRDQPSGCGLRLYFEAPQGSILQHAQNELFSPTAKISNSKLHCKQWRGRLLRAAPNSGEAAPRRTSHLGSGPPPPRAPAAHRARAPATSREGRVARRQPRLRGGGRVVVTPGTRPLEPSRAGCRGGRDSLASRRRAAGARRRGRQRGAGRLGTRASRQRAGTAERGGQAGPRAPTPPSQPLQLAEAGRYGLPAAGEPGSGTRGARVS